MCDGFGGKLHTRLNVANTSGSPQRVFVQDPFAKVVYDPGAVIAPGQGTLVHLTSSPKTPAHTATVHAASATGTVSIARSPCPPVTEPPTTPTTKKPPPTTQPTVSPTSSPTVPATVPFDPGGGPPVGGPGAISAPAAVAKTAPANAIKAGSSGTLPFTGSDMRAFALLGNLLIVIGFVMLLLSHRAKRNAAMLQLAPAPVTVEPTH
jgi:hypothetical protein